MELIPDPEIRAWTLEALREAPLQFWRMPSSISGKYHPEDELTEGGKLLHTKRAFVALLVLMNAEGDFTVRERSEMMSAILLHDVGYSRYIQSLHPVFVRIHYAKLFGEGSGFMRKGERIFRLIESHMGRWTKLASPPVDRMEKLVHYADYIVCMRGTKFSTIEDLPEDHLDSLLG